MNMGAGGPEWVRRDDARGRGWPGTGEAALCSWPLSASDASGASLVVAPGGRQRVQQVTAPGRGRQCKGELTVIGVCDGREADSDAWIGG